MRTCMTASVRRNNYAWVNASVPVCLPCPASLPYSVWNASGVNSSGVLGACTTCPAGHDVVDSSDVLCEGIQGSGPASQTVGVAFLPAVSQVSDALSVAPPTTRTDAQRRPGS
jgi:hypothetical protein